MGVFRRSGLVEEMSAAVSFAMSEVLGPVCNLPLFALTACFLMFHLPIVGGSESSEAAFREIQRDVSSAMILEYCSPDTSILIPLFKWPAALLRMRQEVDDCSSMSYGTKTFILADPAKYFYGGGMEGGHFSLSRILVL
ncbi:hypothetical protein OUZ56_012237 [Daphnia magna]|uniref:Uncharacterized protein n=1 Tax=Daphnia magna TaxID=35525 RepID=A0ABQ9Z2E8_9CRUS|nr:hypothetical protein OUZ56_012237 [Daphnia magna]